MDGSKPTGAEPMISEFKFLMSIKRDLENQKWDVFDAAQDEAQDSGKSLRWQDLNATYSRLTDMADKVQHRIDELVALREPSAWHNPLDCNV
jgi:hypothetical protein